MEDNRKRGRDEGERDTTDDVGESSSRARRGATDSYEVGESSRVNTEPPTSALSSMNISQSTVQSDLLEVIRRPDNGGIHGIPIQLFVNHFPVTFNNSSIIFKYNVDLKPDEQSKLANYGSSAKISKENIREEGPKYNFKINSVEDVELSQLDGYLKGNFLPNPRNILHGLDLVMKENLTKHMISFRRGFYSRELDDFGRGLIASRGFQHSLKPTKQGLVVCVDYSVLSSQKPVSVLEYLEKILQVNFNKIDPLNSTDREKVEKALKDLEVKVIHRQTDQNYKIAGVTLYPSNDLKFKIKKKNQSKEVRLIDYYMETYKEIEYKNLPCLDVSRNSNNYIPIEFCVLAERQRYLKEYLQHSVRKMKNIAMPDPLERKELICKAVEAKNGPHGGDIAEHFEITVNTSMTVVTGYVMSPPYLKLGDSQNISIKFLPESEDRLWNFKEKSVLKGMQIKPWKILDFTASEDFGILDMNKFVKNFTDISQRLHIQESRFFDRTTSTMDILTKNEAALISLLSSLKGQNSSSQILICVMKEKDQGYKNLKRICETKVGILTQCCLVHNVSMLKINAKVGGSTMELFDPLPHLEKDNSVMFVGATVYHPGSKNTSCPSIAAMVGTTNWPAANKYAARIRPQAHSKGSIHNFGEICMELVNTYTRLNEVHPAKIVVFRDGVSDTQFDMVLNTELKDLKKVLKSHNCEPMITIVVAQKQHLTRLFHMKVGGELEKKNVLSGTVVDTKIIHPRNFDFYLCSHSGINGTSKPVRYTVLFDENGFSSQDIQKVIYNLCYTCARCTKPVSLVPPVYYAKLAASRGRLYLDSLIESYTAASPALFDQGLFKLHDDLKDCMFFC
ncbi:hypothetical protein GIB67_041254 [Kingdonia uniflora]|uniref:Argonaute 2 n=1 Tax=Kingdonia uniflora TaxID=39325 RepID=A0A7J7N8F4_9MAGN|nr:hypothetical protein GIB67_041254 [Kingdonia uniflora]